MGTWEERFRARRTREPYLELVEPQWRIKGPSGRVMHCGIFRTDAGLELRAGYGEDLLQSQSVLTVAKARELAGEWRETALAGRGFEELPTNERPTGG